MTKPMKMSNKSFGAINYAFRLLSNRKSIADRREAIVIEGKAQDVEKRLRWDMLAEAGWHGLLPINGRSTWICEQLYDAEGLNDHHIDTALRRAIEGKEK
jgi:hypothetical protein